MSTAPDSASARPPRNNWGWISFFVFVTVASIGVAVFMILFNLSIQLTPEQLDAARKRWKEKAIKNYDMVYAEKHSPDDKVTTFVVRVRGGEVTEVRMNGKPLVKSAEQVDDPRIFRSMDALFRDMDRFMTIDTKKDAPKVYVTATFEVETGAMRRYVRRVMRSTERVEILVKEFTPIEKR